MYCMLVDLSVLEDFFLFLFFFFLYNQTLRGPDDNFWFIHCHWFDKSKKNIQVTWCKVRFLTSNVYCKYSTRLKGLSEIFFFIWLKFQVDEQNFSIFSIDLWKRKKAKVQIILSLYQRGPGSSVGRACGF